MRLLLRHSDWWDRLPADDRQMLHELGGVHGVVVAWLEQQLTEYGPLTWAALDPAMQGQEWCAEARRWVNAAAPDEEQAFDDLRRVIHRLWVADLEAHAQAVITQGHLGREQLDQIGALREQIKAHKQAELVLSIRATAADINLSRYN
ncbi:MAG: hypothetical protein H7Z19_23280 [Chitinophagaceae bacterium]|nr:hypothetical protein [Rubrivivax sp.]